MNSSTKITLITILFVTLFIASNMVTRKKTIFKYETFDKYFEAIRLSKATKRGDYNRMVIIFENDRYHFHQTLEFGKNKYDKIKEVTHFNWDNDSILSIKYTDLGNKRHQDSIQLELIRK